MNAKVHNNLDAAVKSVQAVIGLLQDRDSTQRCGTHEQEINTLADVLEHLRTVDKEFWD
ncbi:MAG: hypothetical protein FWH34_01050 [Desulfovibrionaceae bacterium]|nr:hypothetical protein [Desulfovibrionaceae bacterium]